MATMMRTFTRSVDTSMSYNEASDDPILWAAGQPIAPVSLDELLLIRLVAKLASTSETDAGSAELAQLLRRCRKLVACGPQLTLCVTQEAKALIDAARAILAASQPDLSAPPNPIQAQITIELLAQTASAYRWSYRHYGSSGQLAELPAATVLALLDLAAHYAGVNRT